MFRRANKQISSRPDIRYFPPLSQDQTLRIPMPEDIGKHTYPGMTVGPRDP